ncbi:cytidylate kinase [Arthrobacter sp. PAMC 25486]|uniref:(d)CMP kinase n=1 Tax=Arthrobacter sp. PAMC 25486 TaxID=1494608 RepID=UPI0005361AE7|nr:(d)CMP kinase [Arthrobacter sp. PAMC 25486]AIX99660.1 cytidylate kinase [Arthrobacter sp. PAMC 25486]
MNNAELNNAELNNTDADSADERALRQGKSLVVAVDGPSGSGKSSVSKAVAQRLGLAFLDTGAMYRSVAWHCLNGRISFSNTAAVEAAARTIVMEQSMVPETELVRVNGINVTEAIREPKISEAVSAVATNLGARAQLVRRQQELIAEHGHRIVVEGRDITTVVAPNAEARLILTASEEARLRRRGLQLGGTQSAEQLAEQVLARDAKDATVVDFQRAADGVYTVDSSDLDFEQTVDAVIGVIRQAVKAGPAG